MRVIDLRLFRQSKDGNRYLVVVLSLAITASILLMIQAGIIATLIVRIFHDRPTLAKISGLLIALCAVFAARALLAFVGEQVAVRAGTSIRAQLRSALVDRVLGDAQTANRFGSTHISMLATRGINSLDSYFARFLPQLLVAVTVPPMVATYILYLDTTSGLIVIGTVPLIPLLGALIGSYTGAATQRKWRTLGILSGYFLDLVSGIATLKVFGRSKKQEENLNSVGEEYRRNTMEVLRISFLSSLVLEIIATLSVALIAVSIGLRLVGDSIGLRIGLLVLILAPEVYWPLRMLGTHFHAAADGIEAAKQVVRVLDSPSTPAGLISVDHIGEIVISPLLISVGDRGAQVRIPQCLLQRGRIVAVTGSSGAGKSTLLSLLLGFLQQSEGTVLVNGSALNELDMIAWRSHIAWLPQQPRLNRGTIRELIQIGRPQANDLEIKEALREAGLSVGLFSDGLDTVIGEAGAGISVGQARRIAFARALIRRADLLLLDEPSAALDDISEAEIVAAVVREAKRGAMVVVVSHHKALIEIADEIIDIQKADRTLDEVASGG